MYIQYLTDESLESVVGGVSDNAQGSLIGFLDAKLDAGITLVVTSVTPNGKIVGTFTIPDALYTHAVPNNPT